MGKNIWKFWPLSRPNSTSFTSIELSPKKHPAVDSPTKWEFLSELASQLVWTNLRTVGKTEWTVFSNRNDIVNKDSTFVPFFLILVLKSISSSTYHLTYMKKIQNESWDGCDIDGSQRAYSLKAGN